ncbi:MAG: M23 family metallopeptidase [Rhodoferax sp.]|nr:M23 family metallopeptidase [Rhodoferax sp.]
MSQSLALDPPVRGQWAIMNPPGHAKLAFDFLAVDDRKSPYKGVSLWRHVFSTISVENTLAWGQPVFSVLEGTVVAASDGAPDRERINMTGDLLRLMLFGPKVAPPFSALGGNYVILKCGDVYPLYAHLKQGSVCVRAGDRVRSGDLLGKVGNSGSSLQPHLHFQVMSNPEPFPLFRNLVPFVISSASRRSKKQWQPLVNEALKNGDHLQFQG